MRALLHSYMLGASHGPVGPISMGGGDATMPVKNADTPSPAKNRMPAYTQPRPRGTPVVTLRRESTMPGPAPSSTPSAASVTPTSCPPTTEIVETYDPAAVIPPSEAAGIAALQEDLQHGSPLPPAASTRSASVLEVLGVIFAALLTACFFLACLVLVRNPWFLVSLNKSVLQPLNFSCVYGVFADFGRTTAKCN